MNLCAAELFLALLGNGDAQLYHKSFEFMV